MDATFSKTVKQILSDARSLILAASDFLEKLPNLNKLMVSVYKHPRRVVRAICKLKKL